MKVSLVFGLLVGLSLPMAWGAPSLPYDVLGKTQPSKVIVTKEKAVSTETTHASNREPVIRIATRDSPSSQVVASGAPLSVFQDKLSDGTLGPEMVVIPSGEFDIGSPASDTERSPGEGPVKRISIKGFALGKTEVTQMQWRQVMGNNPPELEFNGCDDCPVEGVNWHDVQKYITQLNARTGKHYRLPSEAEWEYACRGGKVGENYCGGNDVEAVGWYKRNSGKKTHPVAQKQANAFGLYDMSGNVSERVEDVDHSNYEGIPQDGSAWTTGGYQDGSRVLRGGTRGDIPRLVRSAIRNADDGPDDPGYSSGFRLARTLP